MNFAGAKGCRQDNLAQDDRYNKGKPFARKKQARYSNIQALLYCRCQYRHGYGILMQVGGSRCLIDKK